MREYTPRDATHIWTDPVEKKGWWYEGRLSLYKDTPDGWLVWSENTGWRATGNEPEWFEREKAEGFFITMEEYNRGA